MLYIIKNISNDNIVVGKISFRPGSEVKVQDLEPFKKMIEKGYLNVKDVQDNNDEIYKSYIKANMTEQQVAIKSIEEPVNIVAPMQEPIQEPIQESVQQKAVSILEVKDKVLNQAIKENLMEAFFKFYIDKNVSDKDLKLIKWFYQNIGITSKVSTETLDLLENADHYEDLTAVLLNNVYPELLELYLVEKQHENKNDGLSY